MKFRLKHVEGIGWFAQTNLKEMFFPKWYTIGRYTYNFHPEEYTNHPVETKEEARTLIRKYKVSLIPKRTEYFEVD